jgi:hypothetical protein
MKRKEERRKKREERREKKEERREREEGRGREGGSVVLSSFAFLLSSILFSCMPWKDDHERDSFGTKEEMEAPPGPNEIKARVMNDAINWRRLREHLDEGRAECPEIKFTTEGTLCAKDDEELTIVNFPGDAPDKPNRVEETGYYCPKESVYYYHYRGGRDRLDVWIGPCKVTWNRGN